MFGSALYCMYVDYALTIVIVINLRDVGKTNIYACMHMIWPGYIVLELQTHACYYYALNSLNL